jgi:glycosyltransferase involved in cell wall biosynthesis
MPLVLVDLLSYTGTKGGIETYARELYRHIGRAPAEFTFVGLASSELAVKDSSWFPGTVMDAGVSGENRFSWARGELFTVTKFARKYDADLIHGPAMFGPLRPGRPVVISMHDLLYFSHPELMQTKLYTGPVKWMERRGVAHATRLITISEYTARAIDKYLKFPADRVDVIPLAGVANNQPQHTAPRLRDQFLAMGQRSPYKNFEALVRAVATIDAPQRPKLIITGSHGDDPLIPLVESLAVSPWVELKSWISSEELNELKSTATALLDPTLATGFSLPALEAMMIGLPVLMSDTEVFREVGGDAARYFDPTDPASIGQSMLDLMADPAAQREMAIAGRSWAAQFSWSRVAEATLDSFRAALGYRERL